MPQRLIILVTSALLIGGLFVGAPVRVQAVTDTVYVADVLDDEYDGGSCDSPDFTTNLTVDVATIQEAINAVVEIPSWTTVFLCPGTYTINASLVASGDIILEGASAGSTILDGGATWDDEGYDTGGVQILDAADDVTIRNLTFRHGFATSGGAINADTVTLTSSIFTNNRATYGGAIYADDNVTATNSTFTGNISDDYGGAIYADDNATVTRSTFTGNISIDDYGGAVYASSTLTATSSTFTGNSADYGGAIAASTATATSSTFTGNSGDEGGAIYAYGITVTSSTFTNNSADSDGGALYSYGGGTTVTSSTFTNNSADSDGGAINNLIGNATVTSSTFTNNSADSDGGDGGAINALTVIATSSTFTGNSADYGGAISGYDTATVTNSTFTNNSAESSGGAVITYNGIIARSRFTRNTAGEHGGAVALWDQNSDDLQQVRGNTFSRNTASAGGAITLRSCEPTYTRSQVRRVERVNRFSGNRATQQRRTNNIEPWVDDCFA